MSVKNYDRGNAPDWTRRAARFAIGVLFCWLCYCVGYTRGLDAGETVAIRWRSDWAAAAAARFAAEGRGEDVTVAVDAAPAGPAFVRAEVNRGNGARDDGDVEGLLP